MELKSKYTGSILFFRSDYIGVVNFHLALTPLPLEPK